MRRQLGLSALSVLACLACSRPAAQTPPPTTELDRKVAAFLQQHEFGWRDMNVPAADGRALYDLIVSRRLTRGLEIGTSTGHSAIWIAWGLSKTGGRLITIDIDEGRYRDATRNFAEAGLAPYIDARLADAHDLVPRLEGPFDFVFIDADKDWYTNYARAVLPRLAAGGCLTAHNVSPGHRRQMTGDFYEYISGLPDMDTAFQAGVLVSCKRRAG
jgi:predicted O-methyltransferase YrrM